MVHVNKNLSVKTFEYLYMFVMVIYMGQMTDATSAMFSISSDANVIGILIPNILTLILLWRHKVHFNQGFWALFIIVSIWIFAITLKYNIQESRSGLYVLYAIIIANIHTQVYGKSFFPIFENVIVQLAKIAFILWFFGQFLPPTQSLFRLFPLVDVGNGHNILYLYNWLDPAISQNNLSGPFIRNAGCAWEPGRFAIMLLPAIMINLMRNGIKFKHNSNIIWLLLALVSTMSTTGYSIVLVLYVIFAIKKFTLKYIFLSLLIFVPIVYFIIQLDFMSEKVTEQYDNVNSVELMNTVNNANENVSGYAGSFGRFDAMFFEWQNIQHDPIIGYGPTIKHSYFRQVVSDQFVLTGGILKIFGMYGILLGLFLYYLLLRSSSKVSRDLKSNKLLALFLVLVLSSISYVIFTIPVFTTMWLYGVFSIKRSNY